MKKILFLALLSTIIAASSFCSEPKITKKGLADNLDRHLAITIKQNDELQKINIQLKEMNDRLNAAESGLSLTQKLLLKCFGPTHTSSALSRLLNFSVQTGVTITVRESLLALYKKLMPVPVPNSFLRKFCDNIADAGCVALGYQVSRVVNPTNIRWTYGEGLPRFLTYARNSKSSTELMACFQSVRKWLSDRSISCMKYLDSIPNPRLDITATKKPLVSPPNITSGTDGLSYSDILYTK